MTKRSASLIPVVLLALLLTGCKTSDWAAVGSVLGSLGGGELTPDTMAQGLREALAVGIRNTVAQTGKEGGYLQNPAIRIPLPDKLKTVGDSLRKVGLGEKVDLIEAKMNAAAEEAAQGALPVFMDAISKMTFADAKAILHGSDTAATDFLQRTTSDQLRDKYTPITAKHMHAVGLVNLYEGMMNKYRAIPFVPKVDFSMEQYVTDHALKGLFNVLAEEEQEIRRNPAARTTALLQRVFTGVESK